jgi:hypothetical protein
VKFLPAIFIQILFSGDLCWTIIIFSKCTRKHLFMLITSHWQTLSQNVVHLCILLGTQLFFMDDRKRGLPNDLVLNDVGRTVTHIVSYQRNTGCQNLIFFSLAFSPEKKYI